MIKLADYLSYLNQEIASARKAADENSIAMAKEYSKHEYLRYFSAPRFTIPIMKLDVPVSVDQINYEKQFRFEFKLEDFLMQVNVAIENLITIRKVKLPFLKASHIKGSGFLEEIEKLKERTEKSENTIDELIQGLNLSKTILDRLEFGEVKREEAEKWYIDILQKVLRTGFVLEASRFKELLVNPKISDSKDLGGMVLRINLELEEGGLRIMKVKDKDGREVEEIVFE